MTAPSKLAAAEGPILTLLEAADGTQITGKTDAGSTVAVTFVNGAIQLVKQASVIGTDFTVSLTAAEIEMLGEGYVKYSAVASTGGIDSAPSPTSQFFFTHQPIVDALTRLDSGGSLAALSAESSIGVTALAGGGFAVRWVVDANGDGNPDGMAVQRYAADGAKQGSPTMLQGLSSELLMHGDHVNAFDLAALDGGGYALSYSMAQTRNFHQPTLTSFNAAIPVSVPIVGRPTVIVVFNTPPAGATYSLSAIGPNGSPVTIPLTLQNSEIVITQAILDQIGVQDRTTLLIGGLPAGQSVSLLIEAAEDAIYDPASALHSVARSVNVSAAPNATSGSATLGLPATGRVESFHIDTATFAEGANHTYLLLINTPWDGHAINLGGVAGAIVAPNGQIQISVTPDANGNVAVPQSILDQIGIHDASIYLAVIGLQPGTTVTGSVGVRDAISLPEGVFVQHFGADGVSLGDPGARIDTGGTAAGFDTYGVLADTAIGVTPLAGGGYAVRWLTDSSGDGYADGIAVQRYGADGTKQGNVTVLQGLSETLLHDINSFGANLASFNLAALDNGGFALSYAITLTSFSHSVNLTTGAANQTLPIPVVGHPTSFTINAAPPGASFALVGTGNAGTTVTIPLTVQNGVITVTNAILDQLSIDNRMTLAVTAPQSANIQVTINVQEDVSYDSNSALRDVSRSSVVVGPQGGASGSAVLNVPNARAEHFHIDSATFAAGANHTYLLVVNPIEDAHNLFVNFVPGATLLPNGQVQISVTPDFNGDITVPPELLGAIGNGDAQIYLVVGGLQIGSTLSGTVAVHDAIPAPSGVFVQTFGADGAALNNGNVAISGAASPPAYDADTEIGVTPLDGGGFVVHWAVDNDGNGSADGFAVQRYGADGAKQGGVTLLQGISSDLITHGDHIGSVDFAALANGGYALSYAIELERFAHFATVSAGAANQALSIPIVGRPASLYIVDAPPNAAFTLTGVGNGGGQVSVPVTVQNGAITITQAILDQFGVDDRMTLMVTGLNAGESVAVNVVTVEDITYDPTAALHDISSSFTLTGPQGAASVGAVLRASTGRGEAFHIDSATFAAGATPSYRLTINPIQDGHLININGIAGATLTSNGQIQITVTPDANGNIAVPQAILDQLGVHDAGIYLTVFGLQIGSTFSGTVSVHDPIHQPEGVYVQTFGADGVAISADLHLVGGSTDDVLLGDIGNDTLTGGDGNDVLDGGAGHDLMIGGLGSDVYIVDNMADIVVENADEGFDNIVTSLDNYVLSETGNVDQLTLLGSAITGSGNSLSNIITGNALGNILYGKAGDDWMAGGAGADTVDGGDGNDVLFSQDRDPYAYAFFSYAGISTDLGTEADTLIGGNGDDYIYAGYGDNVDGGAQGAFGNRLYISFQGATSGVNADFRLLQTQSAITIGGGIITNIQSVGYLEGSQYDDVLAPIDSFFALEATVYGRGGNDRLISGAGSDTLIGGTGNDTYVVNRLDDIIVENANEGTDTIETALTYSLAGLTDVENLTLTGTAAVNGTGNALANVLIGNAAANTLTGNDGADILNGNGGADTLIGGLGDDLYVISDASTVIVENAGEGSDTIKSSVSYVLGAGVEVETVRLMGTANLDLTGNAGSQSLGGNSGNNVLDGGGGGDNMKGGAGNDTYIVRSAGDHIVEVAGEGDDTVRAALSFTLGAAVQVEHLMTVDATATTAINLTGNAYSHDIQGNAGVNVLTGGSGNDVLDGGTGADQMQGGTGSDSYFVDDAADTVFEANTGGVDYDTVVATVSWVLGAGQEVERLRAGPGTDPINLTGNEFGQKIQGNEGANILLGDGGNDVIIAGGGDDTLKGGTGLDKLTGGLGADTFVFEHGGQMDQIVDFAVGTDKVDLTAFGLTWQDVQAAMTESNGNTILTLGGGDSVIFAGVSETSLSASDFLLGGNILSNTLQSDMWDGGRDDMLHAHIQTSHAMFEWHML